jgi:hypothetical protein
LSAEVIAISPALNVLRMSPSSSKALAKLPDKWFDDERIVLHPHGDQTVLR